MPKEKTGLLFYLVLEGKTAESLFSAGPEDLMEYFFPQWMGTEGYKKEDVLICKFENELEGTIHKENYQRPDKPIKRK